jgi:hypothetical protein
MSRLLVLLQTGSGMRVSHEPDLTTVLLMATRQTMGLSMNSQKKSSTIEGAASLVITWLTESVILTSNQCVITIVNQCSSYIFTSDAIDSHASFKNIKWLIPDSHASFVNTWLADSVK